MEAFEQVGAGQYERTETWTAHRNGTRDRTLCTRCGAITLAKPQFRKKPFETQVFGRYARVEKALVNAIAESYLQGVSTRKVEAITSMWGSTGSHPRQSPGSRRTTIARCTNFSID